MLKDSVDKIILHDNIHNCQVLVMFVQHVSEVSFFLGRCSWLDPFGVWLHVKTSSVLPRTFLRAVRPLVMKLEGSRMSIKKIRKEQPINLNYEAGKGNLYSE
jgi:hypothetical protein